MQVVNKKVWAGNAASNLLSGAVGAAVGLVVPALLARHFARADFSVWSLAFAITMYVQVLSTGVMSTTSRYIATALSKKKSYGIEEAAAGAVFISSVSFFVNVIVILVYALGYPYVVSGFDGRYSSLFTVCVLLFGLGSLFQGVAFLPAGVFIGYQLNKYWAFSQILSKLLLVGAMYIVVLTGQTLVFCAVVFSVFTAISAPVAYLVLRKNISCVFEVLFSGGKRWAESKSMLKFYSLFSVLNINVLIVSAASASFVGVFDYEKVAPFSLGVTLINIIVGVLQALVSPIVPYYIRAKDAGGGKAALSIALDFVAYVAGVLAFFTLVFVFFGESLLSVWVGRDLAIDAYPIMLWLVVSAAIRNSCLPLSMLMLGLGRARSNVIPSIIESLLYVSCSGFLGAWLGVKGVLIAAIVGSIGSVISYCFVLKSEFSKKDLSCSINLASRKLIPSILALLLAGAVSLGVGHA